MSYRSFSQRAVFKGTPEQIRPYFSKLEKYAEFHPWMKSVTKAKNGKLRIDEPVPLIKGIKIPNSYLAEVEEKQEMIILRASTPLSKIKLTFRFSDLGNRSTEVSELAEVTGFPFVSSLLIHFISKTHQIAFQKLSEHLNNG
jgi:hypothetical protein